MDAVDDDAAEVAAWLEGGRAALRHAHGEPERIAAAVREFSIRGRNELMMSPLIVWDYLAISTPSLLQEAGSSLEQVEALDAIVEQAWVDAFDGWSPRGPGARPTE
jgi:hypothetical protein